MGYFAFKIELKALGNGFNICFNILSIFLNDSVESISHPLSTVLKRVETMLNRCWKSLKAFKLCSNIRSTFLLFSGMFGMLTRSWSHLVPHFSYSAVSSIVNSFTMLFRSIVLSFSFGVFYPHHSKFQKLQKPLITSELCCKPYERSIVSLQNDAFACVSGVQRAGAWS